MMTDRVIAMMIDDVKGGQKSHAQPEIPKKRTLFFRNR
jgi:hypothetical protein